MGISDHLTYLLRNLYAGQEATVRTGHGTTDWFQIGKGVRQGCKLSVQFSSVAQSCPTLCNPMDCSTPGFPVHHQLPELIQTHVLWVCDAIQPSHPLSSPFPPAFNHSQHQGLFKRVSSSHQVAFYFFPLGWTGWISLQSKGLSTVFSNTTLQKHQLLGAQPSL